MKGPPVGPSEYLAALAHAITGGAIMPGPTLGMVKPGMLRGFLLPLHDTIPTSAPPVIKAVKRSTHDAARQARLETLSKEYRPPLPEHGEEVWKRYQRALTEYQGTAYRPLFGVPMSEAEALGYLLKGISRQ